MRASSLSLAITRLAQGSAAWSPLSLWPDGIASPGMWISPRTLDSQWQDYTGTTPVATPGSVADSANPVGLALDIRAGAPDTLGPELVTNGDFSAGASGWTIDGDDWVITTGSAAKKTTGYANGYFYRAVNASAATVRIDITVTVNTTGYGPEINCAGASYTDSTAKTGVYTFIVPGFNGNLKARNSTASAGDLVITSISVREIPGLHLSQSTSAARPVASGRVNLLQKTEDFSDAYWAKTGGTTAVLGATAPDGTATAWTLTLPSGGAASQLYLTNIAAGTPAGVQSIYARCNGANPNVTFGAYDGGGYGGRSVNPVLTTSWQRISLSLPAFTGSDRRAIWIYQGNAYTNSVIEIWHPQLNLGSTALDYQRVNTASDYTATGITPWQLYDGVDDSMATASFAAGTLINGMDCMIAVRRNSGANCVAGLYNGVSDATKFFGMAESASGSGCVGSGAGTPTVWVDNTQLTGGTAVTRGTLHTALTVGDWHILEFRNLDLSAWTATGFGLYTSYVFPGARGDIMLFESTASTADKDAARQYLADYYGVTLP